MCIACTIFRRCISSALTCSLPAFRVGSLAY